MAILDNRPGNGYYTNKSRYANNTRETAYISTGLTSTLLEIDNVVGIAVNIRKTSDNYI